MIFSLDMEAGSSAQRQFIIENTNSGEEIGVDISDVVPGKPQNILALLDGTLQPSTQYKITVIDIRDKEGNTIESGIDAFVNFATPDVFMTALESAGTQEENTPEEPEVTQENTSTQENTQIEENTTNA
jgi:hypothetical protein